jgi:cytochrome c5
MTRKALTFALLLFASTAEAQQPSTTRCTEPRPQMCTQIYSPVCAAAADGTKKTYGNSCSACAEKIVVSHTPGTCT